MNNSNNNEFFTPPSTPSPIPPGFTNNLEFSKEELEERQNKSARRFITILFIKFQIYLRKNKKMLNKLDKLMLDYDEKEKKMGLRELCSSTGTTFAKQMIDYAKSPRYNQIYSIYISMS